MPLRLTKVEFINFRSISGDVLDTERDITCLVGVNESGKSNVLLALEKINSGEKLSPADISRHSPLFGQSDTGPEIRLWFEVPAEEQQELAKLFGQKSIDTLVLKKVSKDYTIEFPAVIYEQSSLRPIPPDNQQEGHEVGTNLTEETKKQVRTLLVSELTGRYIPKFLRFDSVNFDRYYLPETGEVSISSIISDPTAHTPVVNLLYLGGIEDLSVLVANNESDRIRRDTLLKRASERINREIIGVVWPIETVEVELTAENDILKIRLKEKGQTSPFMPSERSRGLQWALAFNIYFLAETQRELKGTVLLVDEPGIFLHIDGQKRLLEQSFRQIVSRNNQVIYTTHLPYLIDAKYPERIRILERDNENTVIGNKAWSSGEFGKLPEPVRTALNLNWENVFQFGNRNVFVEGPSDQIILRTLSERTNIAAAIDFLPAYGAEKIPSVLALAKLESRPGAGLIDGDKDIKILRAKCALVSLPPEAIRSIPELLNDSNYATIEDILPWDIFAEAVFQVYLPICHRRGNASLDKKEIPTGTNRVKKTEQLFAVKFRAKEHKLLKMEVARSAIRLFPASIKQTNANWKVGRALLRSLEKLF